MIGGRKVRSNKGKRRGSYRRGTGKTRSGAKFRGRNPTVKRTLSNNKPKRTRKVRSNKGKPRSTYRRGLGRTHSGRKFRGGSIRQNETRAEYRARIMSPLVPLNAITATHAEPKTGTVSATGQQVIPIAEKTMVLGGVATPFEQAKYSPSNGSKQYTEKEGRSEEKGYEMTLQPVNAVQTLHPTHPPPT
jgi:hypothetical protein